MKNKQGQSLKNRIIAMLAGLLISVTVSLLLIVCEAALILNGTLSLPTGTVISVAIHIISAYLGCIVAGVIGKESAPFVVAGVVTMTIVVHGFISAFSYRNGLGNFLPFILSEFFGCGIAMLTLLTKRNHRKTRRVKKRYL